MADYRALVKYGNAIAISETKPLYEKRHTLANTILRPPVCLVCRLVARVADEGRGHTHTHTHTQDDYRNPRCACAPRVNRWQHNTLVRILKPTSLFQLLYSDQFQQCGCPGDFQLRGSCRCSCLSRLPPPFQWRM